MESSTLPREFIHPSTPEFWFRVSGCVGLLIVVGVISGLERGLLSIEPMHLAILELEGSPSQKHQAKKIGPLVAVTI
jgi:hypothetical protein